MPATDPPSANETQARLLGARTAVLVERLITLDSLWTAELAQAAQTPAPAMTELRALAGELRGALDEMSLRALDVRQVLERASDEDFDKALDALNRRLMPERPILITAPATGGPTARTIAIAGCDYVAAHADAESTLMRQDLERVDRGEPPTGQFRPVFKCALFLVGIGAVVVGTIGIGGPAPFVALAVAGLFTNTVVGWEASSCPSFLPAIQAEPPAAERPTMVSAAVTQPRSRLCTRRFSRAGQTTSGGTGAAPNPHRGQHLAVFFLGLVALGCAAGVVFVVLHRATGSSTAAITAMSSLGAAAVGGIAGVVTGIIQPSEHGQGGTPHDTHP